MEEKKWGTHAYVYDREGVKDSQGDSSPCNKWYWKIGFHEYGKNKIDPYHIPKKF